MTGKQRTVLPETGNNVFTNFSLTMPSHLRATAYCGKVKECGIPAMNRPENRTLFFCVFLSLAFDYSNLSGTEIVVIAIAAIAAMAVTTIIILFIICHSSLYTFRAADNRFPDLSLKSPVPVPVLRPPALAHNAAQNLL